MPPDCSAMSFAHRSPALPSAKAGPTAADSFHGAGLSCGSWAGAPAATSSSTASSRARDTSGASGNGDRPAGRARRALDRHRREHVDELVLPVLDELVEDQVLVVEDAVLGDAARRARGRRDSCRDWARPRCPRCRRRSARAAWSTTQRATSRPIPGSPALKRSLFFIHSAPQPVLKKIASPGLMSLSSRPCLCSAARTSASVISSPASNIRPFSPATSIRCARVKNGLHFSMPSFLRP